MNDDDDLVRIEVKLTDKCWKILLTVTSFNDEESDSWLTDTVLLEIKVFFFQWLPMEYGRKIETDDRREWY